MNVELILFRRLFLPVHLVDRRHNRIEQETFLERERDFQIIDRKNTNIYHTIDIHHYELDEKISRASE